MQKELNDNQLGRTTLKTFFKSSNEKQAYNEQLQRHINQLDSTSTSYQKLSVIIDQHLI